MRRLNLLAVKLLTGRFISHMAKLPRVQLESGAVAEKLAFRRIERLNEALTRLSDADADPKRLDREKQSKLGEYVR